MFGLTDLFGGGGGGSSATVTTTQTQSQQVAQSVTTGGTGMAELTLPLLILAGIVLLIGRR
jgi:hypothetical protein